MTRRFALQLTSLAVAAAISGACLIKTERHAWYLDAPSGAVTWTAMEEDVRSDAGAPADRTAEELAYWQQVETGTHTSATAFRQLGATEVQTRVLRAEAPFSVVTDGRFESIEHLGRQFAYELGLQGSSVLEWQGDEATWTLTLREPQDEDTHDDNQSPVVDLAAGLDDLRIVLSRGQFISATGFRLRDDRVAVLPDDDLVDENGLIVLQLRWRAAAPSAVPSDTDSASNGR